MRESGYLLSGPRVAIRHLEAEDADEYTACVRASQELHHPWISLPRTREDFTAYLQRFDGLGRKGFVICERDSGRLAAGVAINGIEYGSFRSGSLGYGAFAHAAGRGLMTEGLGLVVRHAFDALALHRLEANVQPGNEPSRRLVRRLGFRLEGLSPDFLFINGAWRDHERWAVTTEMLAGTGGAAARTGRAGADPAKGDEARPDDAIPDDTGPDHTTRAAAAGDGTGRDGAGRGDTAQSAAG
ncbi:GNAT family N-acetyltransferase [Streptomyces lycii]|uniref:GNAT family N-acetyltransferase n=1 Tax=Streptomyces lycii TaxID=2654337 RepID=UPI002E25274F